MMQSGCNRRSGATPLLGTFEGALMGSEGEVCCFIPSLHPDPLLGSALRCQGWRVDETYFFPVLSVCCSSSSASLSTRSLTSTVGFFPPIFIPAKTLVIKDAHLNESVTFLYKYIDSKCHNIPLEHI